MEPAVLDSGSLYLKAGFASPDQDPPIKWPEKTYLPEVTGLLYLMCLAPAYRLLGNSTKSSATATGDNKLVLSLVRAETYSANQLNSQSAYEELILPTAMARVEEDGTNGTTGAIGDVVHPIERGMIKDWDAMEDLWRYVFYTGLGWEPGNEGQLLVAEPLLTPKVSRERMVQTMFETFNVSGLYAMEQAVLSLYAVGRITGVAIDVGHGKIDIAPVWEGAIQHNAVKRFEIAGQDLTNLLAKELARSQPHVKLDLATVEMLKEKYAMVPEDSADYAATAEACPKIEHTLPDGQVISVGRERFTVGEALLRPSVLGIEEDGLADQLLRSVSMCYPSENQRQLIENIVLCGGTSMMTGLDARFQKEAILLANPSVRPSLIKPPDYMPDNTLSNSAWMGGAILAKVVFPQNQHITKAEYDEAGPPIVYRKC